MNLPENEIPDTQKGQFRRILMRTMVLPPLFMGVLAVVLLWQIDRLLSLQTDINNSSEITVQAFHVEKLIIDLETGVRGYLITGDPIFLQPYNLAIEIIDPEFQRLKNMAGVDPGQKDTVAHLEDTLGEWKQFAVNVVGLRNSGGDYAAAVRNFEGKRLVDKMRDQLGEFVRTEDLKRNNRISSAQRSTYAVVGSSLGAFVVLSLLLTVFSRRQLIAVSRTYDRALQASSKKSIELQES